MHVVYERCAGLDVHKRTVVSCAKIVDAAGGVQKASRTFSTMTTEVLRLRDWLKALGVTHIAMESTGCTGNRSTICSKGILSCWWSMPSISKPCRDARCDVKSHRELLQRATKLSRSLLF